ncbi:hypothetical protein [Mycobacterium sp. 852002-51971_SCH5477799-a]|uniref:hypothetical protein n=1 Tax=Mycobacterium sp. 852002-51971_SCH5477799-a TaxID=1834106 RepID=UPI0012E6FF8C|nr:hypothetical protein [Mycobacterium sp. 852002-51971_SCH5477799-a]
MTLAAGNNVAAGFSRSAIPVAGRFTADLACWASCLRVDHRRIGTINGYGLRWTLAVLIVLVIVVLIVLVIVVVIVAVASSRGARRPV